MDYIGDDDDGALSDGSSYFVLAPSTADSSSGRCRLCLSRVRANDSIQACACPPVHSRCLDVYRVVADVPEAGLEVPGTRRCPDCGLDYVLARREDGEKEAGGGHPAVDVAVLLALLVAAIGIPAFVLSVLDKHLLNKNLLHQVPVPPFRLQQVTYVVLAMLFLFMSYCLMTTLWALCGKVLGRSSRVQQRTARDTGMTADTLSEAQSTVSSVYVVSPAGTPAFNPNQTAPAPVRATTWPAWFPLWFFQSSKSSMMRAATRRTPPRCCSCRSCSCQWTLVLDGVWLALSIALVLAAALGLEGLCVGVVILIAVLWRRAAIHHRLLNRLLFVQAWEVVEK